MSIANNDIHCSTFVKQESAIKRIMVTINMTEKIKEKAKYAKQLQDEVDVLISCPDFDVEKSGCCNCHFIADLREKTTQLIIRAEKLCVDGRE